VGPQMWVYSPVMLPPSHRPRIRRVNSRLIACQVRLILRILGFRRWFTWVTVPTACDVLEKLPASPTIFNRSDAFSKFPEAREDFIRSCEDRMLVRSDLTLYVNKRLMAEDIGAPERKHYLGHGVDFDFFAGATHNGRIECPEFAGLKRPIVGFFGAIDDYTVDLGLLKRAAQSLPDMSFVLIGLSTLDISDITSLPNVRYLGFRPYAEIPRLGAAFDVAIMPWLRTDWITYCNPVKLKEYLSLGLPVVTTPIPQADAYPGLLRVAASADQFIEAIRRCAGQKDPESVRRRQQAVAADSWHNKALEVLRLAEETARSKAVTV